MYVLVAHQSAPCDCFDNALTPPFKSMSYLRYLFTILLTLTMFYGWASPSVATSQFVCRGVGLTEPERSSLWNLSDVSTLDKAGLNLAPRYVATSVHDGDSVRTIISEIIDGRRMRYLVDGSNLIWIGEETPEMHIMVDTLCYTSALLPFGDVSIPLSLHYRSNVIRSDGALVQSATYYPYGEPHRAPKNLTATSTSSNPYLYGGKEYVRRDGLREYVYGARMCVSSETRFNSADELCELRPWDSPYLFCGGNPVRYVDPTGLIFTDNAIPCAKELVAEAFSRVQNSDISKEDKEKFAQVIREIGSMLVSEQTFDVEVFGEEKCESKGVNSAPYTYYNMDNNAVTFAYPSYMFQENKSNKIKNLRLGDTAHEFKHGYQFLIGDLDLAVSRGGILMKSKGVIYYDITDERAAYDREELFSGRHTSNQEILGNPQYKKMRLTQSGIGDITPSDYPDIIEKAKAFNRVIKTRNGKIFRP